MSGFASYAKTRLDDGSAILEWDADGHRYWAYSYNGNRYVVRARVVDDEIKQVRRTRRLGRPQLNTALREHRIEVRDIDDPEVPDPVRLMSRRGPGVVEGVSAD